MKIDVSGTDAVAKDIAGIYQMTDRTLNDEPVWTNIKTGTHMYKSRMWRWVIGTELGDRTAIARTKKV